MQALVQEEKGLHEEERTGYVSDQKHEKRLIQSYQDEIQAYKELKEEEEREGLSQRRRRWLNRQIDDLRDRISQVRDGGSSE